MEQGKPSEIRTIFTSNPIVIEGRTDLVHVRLYHRLLVVNVGQCSADWESCGGLVIMDTDTLRQYHIPASTEGPVSIRYACNRSPFLQLTMFTRRLIRCIA